MQSYKNHIIIADSTVKQALAQLDKLAADAVLFVVDGNDTLVGSLTDGDFRRGFLKGLTVDNKIGDFVHANPKSLVKGKYSIDQIIDFRSRDLKIIPVVNDENRIVDIINFRYHKSYLPVDAVIMAGGKGERLRPLTQDTPKPLLKIGDVPIIEHNINRLQKFGVTNFWLSVHYLGEQIEEYFKDGSSRDASISYVWEKEQRGTIGAVSQIEGFVHDYVLVSNSDILTNLDYESFFLDFIRSDADLSVLTIPYHVNIPYAVLETDNGHVVSFKEKPTYTYYSNGGIYLMKRETLGLIPSTGFYNTTDLMENLLSQGKIVHSYPSRDYWLDIGKHEDYQKAQQDIKFINF